MPILKPQIVEKEVSLQVFKCQTARQSRNLNSLVNSTKVHSIFLIKLRNNTGITSIFFLKDNLYQETGI